MNDSSGIVCLRGRYICSIGCEFDQIRCDTNNIAGKIVCCAASLSGRIVPFCNTNKSKANNATIQKVQNK